MSDETTPGLTALLAEHWFVVRNVRPGSRYVGCACGWQQPEDNHNRDRHNAHLAEQITAAGFGLVRAVEAERDAALAEVARADHVTDTLVDRARRIGMSVRAANPSRYAGWTEDQWVADAVAIMDSIDGSCAELVNGHVHALIRKAARAESAEAALAGLREGIEAALNEARLDHIVNGGARYLLVEDAKRIVRETFATNRMDCPRAELRAAVVMLPRVGMFDDVVRRDDVLALLAPTPDREEER